MQVFVVFNVSRPVEVAGAINARFPNDHLPLEGGVWLVAGQSLTTRDVGDAIGISGGQNGNEIINPMEAYWGRAPSDIWEWVGQKRELANGSP